MDTSGGDEAETSGGEEEDIMPEVERERDIEVAPPFAFAAWCLVLAECLALAEG
jgi:hypothetical protein